MIQMINDFQKSLSERPNVMWEIVKVFHPDMDDYFKNRLKFNIRYANVYIELKEVSIMVKFECNFISGPKPISYFVNEVLNNQFEARRTGLDSKFQLEDKEKYQYLKILYKKLVNDILKRNYIAKPTAKQMSDYYHSDIQFNT